MVPGYPGVVPAWLPRWGPLVARLGPWALKLCPFQSLWYQGVVPVGYLSSVPGYLSLFPGYLHTVVVWVV